MNNRISDKILYLKEYNMLIALICDYDGDDKALFYWRAFCEELVRSDTFITLFKSNNAFEYVRGEFEHFIEVMRIIVPTFNINFPSMREAYCAYEEYKAGYFSSANYSEYIKPIDWKQEPYNYFIYVEGWANNER